MLRRLIVCTTALALLLGSSVAARASMAGKVAPKASEGCDAHAKVAKGERLARITSGGASRTYYRFIPPAYNGKKPLPVVFDFHGHSEPYTFHKNASGLGRFGATHGFITITPQGSGPPPKWETTDGSADLTFITDLLDEVEATLCVDTRRIFATGYSNGAFVTSVLACQHADRFAAFAAVAGIRNPPACAPTRPVPILAFHGTGDEWIAYDGGYGPGVYSLTEPETQELIRSGEATYSDLSIPEVVAAWAARNDCDATPAQKKVADDVTFTRYTCPNHADVQLYAIDGAGHTWPGSRLFVGLKDYIGPTSMSIDADAVMWKFFQRHPLRGA